MLAQRRGRWANISLTKGLRVVFAGYIHTDFANSLEVMLIVLA